MISAAVRLLLLSWAVGARVEDEFEEPEDARSVPPKNQIMHFPHSQIFPPTDDREFQELLRQPEETREPAANTVRSTPPAAQHFKEDAALLFQSLEACRQSHPSITNKTFNLQLYGGLLGELMGLQSEAFKAALRRCNISEDLVGNLKAKLSQLDIFQDVFVLIPRNNSSESPRHGKPTQQTNSPASRKGPQATAIENNLKLKLGDEWISLEPKVSHLSHIYLGSSLYPILTEESRVLEKEQPVTTPAEETSTRQTQTPSPRVEALGEKTLHRKSTPKAHHRLSRSLQIADVPHRVSVDPRSSFRWNARRDEDMKASTCPVNLEDYGEDPRYRVVYKLCSAIVQHFRKLLKAEEPRQRIKRQDRGKDPCTAV